ncbi:MAG: hypothetical protein FWD43_00970 [Coriobacteriia bacterium]|nr:hypothetical protein [Coriobacteriia bacterium]
MNVDNEQFKSEKKAFKEERKRHRKSITREYKHYADGIGNIGSKDGVFFAEGISNIYGGEFREMYIEGICNSGSNIKAERLDIEGVFNCDGSIDADDFYCEGTAQIRGNVRSKVLNVEGVTEIKGRLEADSIICAGLIRVAEEISSDLINARGAVFAREIVGDTVRIRSEIRNFWRSFLSGRETIDLIEATTIELHRVHAKVVSGQDIHIGYDCQIDRIDCSGTLYIDPTARVGEIVGQYTRKF